MFARITQRGDRAVVEVCRDLGWGRRGRKKPKVVTTLGTVDHLGDIEQRAVLDRLNYGLEGIRPPRVRKVESLSPEEIEITGRGMAWEGGLRDCHSD